RRDGPFACLLVREKLHVEACAYSHRKRRTHARGANFTCDEHHECSKQERRANHRSTTGLAQRKVKRYVAPRSSLDAIPRSTVKPRAAIPAPAVTCDSSSPPRRKT